MSLLALLKGTGTPPGASTLVVDPEAASVPYQIPGRGPYNAPVPCDLLVDSNTPDSCVHPSVWDFGPGQQWNGYRYWMAVTDYGGQHKGEDPNIVASHDGWEWVWPGTNPIWEVPSQNAAAGTTPVVSDPALQWNSDTELWFDETVGKLVCHWREMNSGTMGQERLWSSSSADGVTWETPVIRYETNAASNVLFSMLSPAICKVSANDWRMFCSNTPTMRTAASLYGPWSAPVACTGTGSPWHWGAWYDPATAKFYALGGDPARALTSTNGIAWTQQSIVLDGYTGAWDELMYRPCIRPHPDGKHFRVWYSTQGNWRVGYTVVPRTLWGDPPPA